MSGVPPSVGALIVVSDRPRFWIVISEMAGVGEARGRVGQTAVKGGASGPAHPAGVLQAVRPAFAVRTVFPANTELLQPVQRRAPRGHAANKFAG
jgi:hypothetical protein